MSATTRVHTSGDVATRTVASDGTGDYSDIQTALDSLPAAGGVVYVKNGTYTITTALTPDNNEAIIGSGRNCIIKTTSGVDLISISSKTGVLIANLYLQVANGAGTDAIDLNAAVECKIVDCWLDGDDTAGQNGIRIQGVSIGNVIENCVIEDFYEGARFTDANLRNTFIGCLFKSCANWGVDIGAGQQNNIIGNTVISAGDYGILIDGGDHNLIANNVIATTGDDGIHLTAGSDNNIVKGNKITGWTNEAIDDNGSGNEVGDGHIYVFGITGAVTGGATGYPLPGSGAWTTTEMLLRLPYRGYIRDLYVRALTAPGGVVVDTVTVRSAGSDTAVTTTLTGAGTGNADTANRVQTAASGDTLSVSYAAGGGSVAADIMIVVEVREVLMA